MVRYRICQSNRVILPGLFFLCVVLLISSLSGTLQAETPAQTLSDSTGPGTVSAWERPRTSERQNDRDRMVETQMRGIESERVLEAMRQVPRHLFVTWINRSQAYDDHPLPIGYGQTISQPYIVAYMTEALQIEEGDRILEIGTGSGYQAAVLNELTPQVYSIEIIDELGLQTDQLLRALGYASIQRRTGDGYFGWPEAAPFDGIIVTCAAGHVPPPLIEQLAPGGRMIIPVGGLFDMQRLILVTKNEQGEVRHRNLIPVRFVPMTGRAQ